MLVHPWDKARSDDEWRSWLAEGRDFGTLVVNGLDGGCPDVVPVHFFMTGPEQIAVHLARANPVWPAIEQNNHVAFNLLDDYAFIPGPWRLPKDAEPDTGVPTSYYSAVVFEGKATIVADPDEKARLLAEQMRTYQPEGGYGEIAARQGPYARMLAGIQFAVIDIEDVRAKFKYDDHKDDALRATVSTHLDNRRQGLDGKARAQLDRRRATSTKVE
jgi:transcriptional regulator